MLLFGPLELPKMHLHQFGKDLLICNNAIFFWYIDPFPITHHIIGATLIINDLKMTIHDFGLISSL